jgi:hypothetical protein
MRVKIYETEIQEGLKKVVYKVQLSNKTVEQLKIIIISSSLLRCAEEAIELKCTTPISKTTAEMCMSRVAPVQMTLNCFPFAAAIFSKESTTLEKPWVRTVVPCRIKSCPSMAIVRRACNLKITSILAQAFSKLMTNQSASPRSTFQKPELPLRNHHLNLRTFNPKCPTKIIKWPSRVGPKHELSISMSHCQLHNYYGVYMGLTSPSSQANSIVLIS